MRVDIVRETFLHIVSRRLIARKRLLSLSRGLRAARESSSSIPGVAGGVEGDRAACLSITPKPSTLRSARRRQS